MTIIAIALFMVPFLGLCLFILLLGIADLYKGKSATLNNAASNRAESITSREWFECQNKTRTVETMRVFESRFAPQSDAI